MDGIEIADSELSHIFNVSKLKQCEMILLNDGRGTLATAKISGGKRIVPIEIRKIPEPEIKVHLFVSSPRKQQLDQIITQSCEVGVWSVNLLVTDHSVSIPSGNEEKIERWQSKIIEACKQSHNPYAPLIFPPITLQEAIEKVKVENWKALFGSVKDGKRRDLKDLKIRERAWFVGPEGGFSEREEAVMLKNGFSPLKIGKWIMRVETASVVGIAFLQELFD